MSKFIKSNKYDLKFVEQNLMGPNCLKVLEELTNNIEFAPNKRILDLGCGRGLTSIFMAKEFEADVFATDLWIEATDNYKRFKDVGLDD